MPYNRKRHAKKPPYKRGRKYNKRKAKYQKATSTRMRSPGFTDTMYVRLKYCDTIALSSATTYATRAFRGNGLYDPDYAVGGHQPLYFDQYCEIYQKYRVFGSLIKLNIVNMSQTSSVYFIVEPNSVLSSFSSVSAILEQNRSRQTMVISPNQLFPRRFKHYASTRKVCGLSKAQIDDQWSGTSGADPNEQWYWNLMVASIDGASIPNVNCTVEITYYVEFYDRKQIAQS